MAETMAAVAPKYGAAAATTATGTLQTAGVVSPTISPPIGVDVGSNLLVVPVGRNRVALECSLYQLTYI